MRLNPLEHSGIVNAPKLITKSPMQEIIIEKPYKFIPPHRGNWIPTLIQRMKLVDKYLNYYEGVSSCEVRQIDILKESLRAGHGIILAPNHCRYADPLTLGWIAREAQVFVYAMASWHLFNQGWLQSFAMRMCGGFSVYREGPDLASVDTAVRIISEAQRPLVIFPEGTVFRANDRVNTLLDGVAFLARSAARRRAKTVNGKVMIHPVAIKYLFRGDLVRSVEPVLKSIEERIGWHEPLPQRDLLTRIERLGEALFSLKEIQYLGSARKGPLEQRKSVLIEHLLGPLEEKLLGSVQQQPLLPRIKQLRTKLVPLLRDPNATEIQRKLIWNQLADIYISQQIESYPVGYLDEPTNTRILETVERFDEDLHDQARIHRPFHVILEIGEPIVAETAKPPKNEPDPLMNELQRRIQQMLDRLSGEAEPFQRSEKNPQ